MAKMKELPTDDPLFGKGESASTAAPSTTLLPVPRQEAGPVKGRMGPTMRPSPRSRPTRRSARWLTAAARWSSNSASRARAWARFIPGQIWPRVSRQFLITGNRSDVRTSRHTAAGAVWAVAARADQRLVLCDAVAWSGGHLRPAQHHQFRARRAVHDGRIRRLDAADLSGHRLLVGAVARADHRRRVSAWCSSG
jgi:hypothetical protein